MKTETSPSCEPGLAAMVAAEDLHCGDMVALLNETYEYPSFLWCSDSQLAPPEQPVRIPWRSPDAGIPLRVKAICLPFVFVQDAAGGYRTLDVRQCQLVRLRRDYARLVWRKLRKQRRTIGDLIDR
jgi:hypothetical protein